MRTIISVSFSEVQSDTENTLILPPEGTIVLERYVERMWMGETDEENTIGLERVIATFFGVYLVFVRRLDAEKREKGKNLLIGTIKDFLKHTGSQFIIEGEE